ncbi:MAG: four helix bundle protein [Clostridia bacterium]|nr:four helix bundle protein [Clostridia bacterium]
MENYKELVVWNRGMELACAAYEVALKLPRHETYALSDQIRRSAISIPSNIAEGYGRNSTRDYVRFLSIARGSRYELETQLLLCVKLGYVDEKGIASAVQLGTEVGKMLNVMISKLSE